MVLVPIQVLVPVPAPVLVPVQAPVLLRHRPTTQDTSVRIIQVLVDIFHQTTNINLQKQSRAPQN